MKTKRNLSGIYVRSEELTGSWGNRCLEDLPRKKQEEYINGLSIDELKGFVLRLADTLNDIGEKFDIIIY